MTLGCGPGAQGRGWARTEEGEVRSLRDGESRRRQVTHTSHSPSEPRPARAAQDRALEEQTRTGEPRWALPRSRPGGPGGPGPSGHQDMVIARLSGMLFPQDPHPAPPPRPCPPT